MAGREIAFGGGSTETLAAAPPTGGASTSKVKVLCVSNVEGRFSKLFNYVSKVNASKAGPFDVVFAVGRFFGDPGAPSELAAFLDGTEKAALPLYFIAGEEAAGTTGPIDGLEEGGELCENITYLGRWGKQMLHGLSVCYLSGVYDAAKYSVLGNASSEGGASAAQFTPAYTEEHVEELLIAADAYRQDRGFDVLLTSEWGEGFDNLLAAEDQFTLSAKDRSKQLRRPPSAAVGRLGRELSPRYHFAGGQYSSVQLPVYKNSCATTRFYGLGSTDTVKCKAFGIGVNKKAAVPGVPSPSEVAARATASDNPYTSSRKVAVAYMNKGGAEGKKKGGVNGDEDAPEGMVWGLVPGKVPGMVKVWAKSGPGEGAGHTVPGMVDGMVPGWVPDPALVEAAETEAAELAEAEKAERRKRKKEGGLYADQGGGMAKNDGKGGMSQKQRQKRKRGDPNGPSHNRDKW